MRRSIFFRFGRVVNVDLRCALISLGLLVLILPGLGQAAGGTPLELTPETVFRFTGLGTLRWDDGMRYTGEWVKGREQGQGRYTWPDGSVYEGPVMMRSPHGKAGRLRLADGWTFSGEWKAGVPVSGRCGFEGRMQACAPRKDEPWKWDRPQAVDVMALVTHVSSIEKKYALPKLSQLKPGNTAPLPAGCQVPPAQARSSEALQCVFNAYYGRFMALYARELRVNPAFSAHVVLSMEVLADGSVSQVQVESETSLRPKFVANLKEQAGALQFAPAESEHMRLRYPLSFVPQ